MEKYQEPPLLESGQDVYHWCVPKGFLRHRGSLAEAQEGGEVDNAGALVLPTMLTLSPHQKNQY